MRKQYILYIVVILLSIINAINFNNASALSYSSEVSVGFTFNPTLSVSLSSSDLVISNLAPGSSADSNSINVSVATNASYGYTLSVNADSDNLAHSNNINTFSSIATNADLASLTTDNTWGYSTSLDNGSTWSNYNGLSSSISATLLDTNTNNLNTGIDTIDFQIGAKAGNTQASGIYTNTITFTAVTKPAPMTLAEAYASEGKTMVNGFYTMQDMTSTICDKVEAIGAQLQVLDIRDYKVYWIAKLADNHCWMTQNLDLDLDSNRTYTHWDTDLGWSIENGNSVDESATWQPERSTINFTIGSAISSWQDNTTEPYSANPGDVYFYTSNSDENDIQYNSLQECVDAGYNDCNHYHAGNYYNWSAAVANNDTSGIFLENAPNSICPNSWFLPEISSSKNDFRILVSAYPYSADTSVLRKGPLYIVRSGYTESRQLNDAKGYGYFWTKTATEENEAVYYGLKTAPYFSLQYRRIFGFPIRCLAR